MSQNHYSHLVAALLCVALSSGAPNTVHAANESCMECHGEEDVERENGTSVFLNAGQFGESVHSDVECADCHQDAELVDDEHKPDLAPVNCAECHDDEADLFKKSIHGVALSRGDKDAPVCADCHGTHHILRPDDRRSMTYKINVPEVCSKCHSEGTGLSDRHEIGQQKVVETYSMSIHGEGVFKRGLTVAAVCTDCHGSHSVLPHEDPESSIHHDNVAPMCMKCHGEIERVHVKVVKEQLWESKPGEIPACIDCHAPHKIRRARYKEQFTDTDCMACHDNKELAVQRDGKQVALFTDRAQLYGSAHAKVTCIMCHSNVKKGENPPCSHVGEVDCAKCHAEAAKKQAGSIHGKLHSQGNEVAPDCTTCHGTHGMGRRSDKDSAINIHNIPDLCARCHRDGAAAAKIYNGHSHHIVDHYSMSIHGKGLLESGLIVTAVCTSCHGTHQELPASDPASWVHPDRIGQTCANCHAGIAEKLDKSIHSSKVSTSDKPLPSCEDCHSSHEIARVDTTDFRSGILKRCGTCHKELTEAYFDTYHGKVSLLGEKKTAKCADCHSAHSILPQDHPDSTLSREHIVETCAKCHPGSHRQFAGYLTHATHKDPQKYPVLYYVFWFMTFLLIGTLAFFTLHTLAWLPRSLREFFKRRKEGHIKDEPYVMRFQPYHRVTHLLVIISFFGLAITGMMLKFSYAGWAQTLSVFLGGFEASGTIHRLCAIITFVYFAMHLTFVFNAKRRSGLSWFRFIFHRESAFFNIHDIKEFFQTIKWFFGMGPRPNYGRFTYWEKFDYFAVFWGVGVIGLSGLMLWFPEAFTLILPGWMINVATIIHSDEALLAAGFIFTVHFFNTHFRPERFPMDPVIFTGKIPLSEFKEERPRQYQAAVDAGTLESLFVEPPSEKFLLAARIFGLSMLFVGLSLVGLIVYAMLALYQ
jgi:predicted CXXCH cytochrome family protein